MNCLDHGANIDYQSIVCNESPLISAARLGHYDAVKILLSRGANVDLQDVNGNTALIRLANYHEDDFTEQYCLAIVKLILEYDPDLSIINKQRQTAWHKAKKTAIFCFH